MTHFVHTKKRYAALGLELSIRLYLLSLIYLYGIVELGQCRFEETNRRTLHYCNLL